MKRLMWSPRLENAVGAAEIMAAAVALEKEGYSFDLEGDDLEDEVRNAMIEMGLVFVRTEPGRRLSIAARMLTATWAVESEEISDIGLPVPYPNEDSIYTKDGRRLAFTVA